MITIREYARPATLEEAWQLNQKRPNRVLGGMLWLKMEKISVGTAIDLSALGLDTIEETDTEFAIGAMATLRSLETHAALNAATNGYQYWWLMFTSPFYTNYGMARQITASGNTTASAKSACAFRDRTATASPWSRWTAMTARPSAPARFPRTRVSTASAA